METIEKSSCQKIGYLQKPHGIKGGLSLIFEPQYDLSLENKPTLFFEIDGLLVPYFFSEEGIRFRGADSAIIHLDWIDSEEKAKKLTGLSVFLKNDDLVYHEEELSLHHLVGFTLHDSKLGIIGVVRKVEDFGGNLLLQTDYKGKEVLVPFNENLLVQLDENEKILVMEYPEGIFDLK